MQKLIQCAQKQEEFLLIGQNLRPFTPPLLLNDCSSSRPLLCTISDAPSTVGNYVVQGALRFGAPACDFIFDAMVDRIWFVFRSPSNYMVTDSCGNVGRSDPVDLEHEVPAKFSKRKESVRCKSSESPSPSSSTLSLSPPAPTVPSSSPGCSTRRIYRIDIDFSRRDSRPLLRISVRTNWLQSRCTRSSVRLPILRRRRSFSRRCSIRKRRFWKMYSVRFASPSTAITRLTL